MRYLIIAGFSDGNGYSLVRTYSTNELWLLKPALSNIYEEIRSKYDWYASYMDRGSFVLFDTIEGKEVVHCDFRNAPERLEEFQLEKSRMEKMTNE